MKRTFSWLIARPHIWPYRVKVPAGSILFMLGTAIIGMAAVDADVNLLMIIFGLCLGAILVNLFHGWRNLRSISVKRIPPDIAIAGQPFTIRYEIRHRRRWTAARNIVIQDIVPKSIPMLSPEVFVPVIRPGEVLTLNTPAVCAQRGKVPLSTIRVATKFPFGIFSKYVIHRAAHEIVIFPKLGRIQFDLVGAAQSLDAPDGMGRVGKLRGEEEYYGVREYRMGDNPRRIHWRRSARTGQLMVREMSKAQSHQIWCVISTEVKNPNSVDQSRIEQTISAAATLICDALERGMQVGLICDGEPFVVFPPGGGRSHRPRLLRELALRVPTKNGELAAHIRRLAWPTRWHAPCVLFVPEEGRTLSDAVQSLRQALGPVTVMVAGRYGFNEGFGGSKAEKSRSESRRAAGSIGVARMTSAGGEIR